MRARHLLPLAGLLVLAGPLAGCKDEKKEPAPPPAGQSAPAQPDAAKPAEPAKPAEAPKP